MAKQLSTPCPCGSLTTYAQCCEPLHQGQPAPSPEALMRSRYCAFAMGLCDYLLASWHPDTRPSELTLEPDLRWIKLEIVSSSMQGKHGTVHFQAFYKAGDSAGFLEEASRFIKQGDHWLYVDGNPRQVSLP